MRCLVTAGNTREPIDHVRDWGNIFTGNTGFAIAKALSSVAEVHLLTSNETHLAEIRSEGLPNIHASPFRTHADLKAALAAFTAAQPADAIFMTAAVSDYRPSGAFALLERFKDPADPRREHWIVQDVHAAKVKSDHPMIAFTGGKTEKLVDLFRREWNHKGLLVKFKLEVGLTPEELIRVGQASRTGSGADYLVANTLDMVNGPAAGAYLLSQGACEWVPRPELPERMVKLLSQVKP